MTDSVGEQGEGRTGPLRLDAAVDALRALHPALRLEAHLEGTGAVADPVAAEAVIRDLVRHACSSAVAGALVSLATRDVDGGRAPGRWLEVLVEEAGPVAVHVRARLAAELLSAGARLEFSRTPGRGSVTRLALPRSDPAAVPEGAPVILLADDDPFVRQLLTASLREASYHVVAAADGRGALGLAPDHIDLVVTDVLMPHMSGIELARRLRARRPGLKVLFVSSLPVPAGVEVPGPMVQKPLDLEAFARQLPERVARFLRDADE